MSLPAAEIERRIIAQSVEVRSTAERRRIGGYAAVFHSRSQPLDGGAFTEIVEPSFFNRSRNDGWPGVVARYEHDSRMLLGATASGTLRLQIDGIGLDYTCDLPECHSDVWELTQRGDLAGSSMAFQVFDEDWKPNDGGYPVRHLLSGRLIDVAPVLLPAYSDTTVSLRRSFARYFDADETDVAAYEQRGDLRKFFPRHGSRMGTGKGTRPLSYHQRIVQLEGMRWGTPLTPQQEAVEAMRQKTRYERELEMMAMRWAPWEGG
jgi:uncharacterized protein